jgi:hypothetical protein
VSESGGVVDTGSAVGRSGEGGQVVSESGGVVDTGSAVGRSGEGGQVVSESGGVADTGSAVGRSGEAWQPDFDVDDDLNGLLRVKSPLLARAFRGTDRPKH